MNPEKAQQLAKDTDIQIQNLQKDRQPLVNVLDIYAEDGFVIGPDEILNAFNNFETATLPSRVEVLRQSIISSLTEMNRIVAQAQLERKLEHERMDLAVAELKAKLFDNIRNVPESLLTRKMRVGKKIIEEADLHFLQEAYDNLGFQYCEISQRTDYIYFDPLVGEIRQSFLREFHRLTGNKYPSLSLHVQCDNSRIEQVEALMYVVGLKK
jgi:hypothetical protein